MSPFRKIETELEAKGVILSPQDIEAVCERFGVTDESQVDEDFIKIILSLCENPDSPQNCPPVAIGEPKTSDARLSGLRAAIQEKVEQESDNIVRLYQNVPTKVKEKVIDALIKNQQEEEANTPLSQFKNVVDFSVVFAQDSVNSRNFTRQVFGCLFGFSVFIFIFSGVVNYESHQATESARQGQGQ